MNNPREKCYRVYKHTSPDGLVYIGITKQAPENRWDEGRGYMSNARFWRDIQKHGWDAFTHEILAQELTNHEALTLESELIHHFKSTKPEFGYNQDAGYLHPDETSSLTKLKRHYAGKANWASKQQFGDLRLLANRLARVSKDSQSK